MLAGTALGRHGIDPQAPIIETPVSEPNIVYIDDIGSIDGAFLNDVAGKMAIHGHVNVSIPNRPSRHGY